MCLTGDISTGWISTAGRLFYAALSRESMSSGAGGLLYLILKISGNVVSAVSMSYPTVLKGTSGWGCLRASVISLVAIRSLSMEESCGIGELCGENSKVSTMRSLAVDVIYIY
jgi:hypothetical protein